MKLNCKINNPVVVCICKRTIATKGGKLIPHHAKISMKTSEPICKGSSMTLAELRTLKRVVVI